MLSMKKIEQVHLHWPTDAIDTGSERQRVGRSIRTSVGRRLWSSTEVGQLSPVASLTLHVLTLDKQMPGPVCDFGSSRYLSIHALQRQRRQVYPRIDYRTITGVEVGERKKPDRERPSTGVRERHFMP